MADLTEFYSATAAPVSGRPTQMPQGANPSVNGNFSVSGGVGAANVDVWGAIVLLGIAFVLLHME